MGNFFYSDKCFGVMLASIFWLFVLTHQTVSFTSDLTALEDKAEAVIKEQELMMSEQQLSMDKRESYFVEERVKNKTIMRSQGDLINRLSKLVLEYRAMIENLAKELNKRTSPKKTPEGHIA